jgi:uncharacterized protein CbrC (UPF0167 family)
MPTFAELGIPFPLFEADVRDASGYVGLATCVLCGQTRVYCFHVDEIVLPCTTCDREMAWSTWLDEQTTCLRCDTTQPLLALPRDESRQIRVCYACVRDGRATMRKDTVLGMVAWEPAQASHTLAMPVEADAEPDHEAPPPVVLTDGTSVMLPSEPKRSRDEEAAARYGFELVIVARKPFERGGPDMDWKAVRVPREQLMELLRTPAYGTWQGERWLFCCQQPMVYLGDWHPEDFERYAGAGKGRALFEELASDYDHWLWGHGGAGIYVFRCAACGRLDCHCDFD